MKNKSELREVYLARVWLESLAAGEKGLFKKIFLEGTASLLGWLEDITNRPFIILIF